MKFFPSFPRLVGLWIVSGIGPWLPVQGVHAQGDLEAGQRAYAVCAGCHGFQGEGNQDVHAPKLAGQEDWYLARQIAYYQSGVRGTDPNDAHGVRMAVMSQALVSQRALEDVVVYIRSLPDMLPEATLSGDAVQGEALYAVCSACHGMRGEGSAALSAPRLIRMDDWYLSAQLQAYVDGTRGTHRDDIYGQQMVPVMGVLTNEQAVLDLVAYISSLN